MLCYNDSLTRAHATHNTHVNKMNNRKSRSDSISELVKSKSNDVVALPDGITLRDREEEILWEQFTSARTSWRDFDLILVAKMVKVEYDLRRIQATIAEEGYIVKNDRGTKVENALIRVEDTKQRMQLAIIGKLSLGVANTAAVAKNKSGKKSESEMLNKLKKESVASLLAH